MAAVRISLVKPKREQSREEEVANNVSHGIGLVASLLATPPLLMHTAQRGATGTLSGISFS